MQNLHLIQETWDIKRIIVGVILATATVAGVGYGVKALVANRQEHASPSKPQQPFKSVEGVRAEPTQEPQFLPTSREVQAAVEDKVEDIKREVGNLKVEDIATSSPQVQKILKDIQALQQYPKNQAKELCENLCKSF